MSTDFEAVIKSLCPEVSADLTEKEKNALPAMAIAAQGILREEDNWTMPANELWQRLVVIPVRPDVADAIIEYLLPGLYLQTLNTPTGLVAKGKRGS